MLTRIWTLIYIDIHVMFRLNRLANAPAKHVIVRKKNRILGHWELFKDYMRPKRYEGDWLDGYELFKIFVYMSVPMVLLVLWRTSLNEYPDYVDTQMSMFEKPTRDEPEQSGFTSYTDLIDELEHKQMNSIVKARKAI